MIRKPQRLQLKASLTGHLVLSTIHAKDTVNCIYRLLDLNISIEEIRQALIGIVAQCLVEIGTEERKALYEILSDLHLVEAIAAVMRGDKYQLPKHEKLSHQLASYEVKDRHATFTT